ncbi:hypothetical protein ERK19_07610 [Lactobacillus helsingborgensis]|uniref:hypothetical protein n=1 Tax=Lactobacillus TaxID=1578 RepID=UPI000D6ED336|nr:MULTISPECIES: hypothetical protein [Lactobacillus]AWN33925.1 hypothetical protein DLD54_06990 [Lactobacillus helsingborgensis]MBC6357215.1 hypothetical protein [Lactobacillus helsingborgensis]RMC52326.1 hypothetical protein F5ESL0262_06925 [Lactobacillus sp. ESL0262]
MNQIKTPEEFYQDYIAIFAPDSTRLDHLKTITRKLALIINEACMVNESKTADLIGAWVIGTKENRNLENRSSYDAYINQHTEVRHYIQRIIDKKPIHKMVLANLLITDLENSFELDKKILANLVCIDRLLNNKEYSLEYLYFESAGSLINRLHQSTTDWDFLIDCMDKRIRNASAHLNFSYSMRKSTFIGKNVDARNKTITKFEITPQEMLLEILPKQSNIIKAFIANGILLWLSVNNFELYKKALDILD